MKKHTSNHPVFSSRLIQQAIQYCCFLFFLVCFFSCGQKVEDPKHVTESITVPFNAIPEELPPPLTAKIIDPDSILPPTVIPLKKQPVPVQALSNVYPAGTPKVSQIPKNLAIKTLGKNGVPKPIIIPAKKRIVPALQPKPIPALAPVYKEDAIYDINYLSIKQGLPVGAFTILEDSQGQLWLGGKGGLVRYDGNNFFHYTQKEGFFDEIWSLEEDSKGNIWIAGQKGICSYDGQNVTYYMVGDDSENNGFKIIGCPTIMEDSKGNIWFGTSSPNNGMGVFCFDGQNFTVFEDKYWIKEDAYDKMPKTGYENRVNKIIEDSQGYFWWATLGNGVVRYDGQHLIQYTMEEGLVDNSLTSILEDSKGRIWFGSSLSGSLSGAAQKGVSCYQPDPSTLHGAGGTFTNFTKEENLNNSPVFGIIEDAANNLWFSTYNGGLIKYDGTNFTHLKAKGKLDTHNLPVTADSKGNLWVGSSGRAGKLNRFKPNSFVHFSEEQGVSSLFIMKIKKDSKGNIWMGTWGGGVIKYDGQYFTSYTKEHGLCDDYITGIYEDSKGNMWFGSIYNGASRFDGKVFTNYSVGQGINSNMVINVAEDYLGNIWFACGEQGGIIQLNPTTGQFTQFTASDSDDTKKAESNTDWGKIKEDSQRNLWFQGVGWVAKYDSEENQINFVYQLGKQEKVTFILEDDKDNFWFGGKNRLVKVDNKVPNGANKTTLFSKENGGLDFEIASITQDNQNNIWVGSDKGLALLIGGLDQIGTKDWIYYTYADGLKSNVVYAGCLDSKNRMWWANGADGLTMLDLTNFSLPTEAPKNLSLSHIEINQEFLDYRNLSNTDYSNTLAFGNIVKEKVDSIVAFQNYPTTLSLPYDVNHLTFHFSAIDWAASHKIQYSFKMEGLDENWSPTQTEAKADYRNLPYGTHTFKVKAIGEAQVWSAPFEYTFTILPPWWHTWWAYVLYAVLALGTSGWYIQRLLKKLEKEKSLNIQLTNLNLANSRFVPNDFLQILEKQSIIDLKLGDQIATKMTILFADIRDYTTISETMSPEQNFKFINAYLGRMGPIIKNHGGFICQYFGDGIMALFKNDHEKAVKAAIEMQNTLNFYNQTRQEQGKQAIQVGIGLNTGQLMLGVIGDQERYDSSVISDAVNTAARMEGLTKIFGCMLIISETTLQEMKEVDNTLKVSTSLASPYAYRFLGKVKVKGKKVALNIYDFYDGDPDEIQVLKTATKVDFEKAIHFYFNREFGKSADLLKVVLEKYPDDKAAKYYFDKALHYIVNEVSETWSGVEEMVSK